MEKLLSRYEGLFDAIGFVLVDTSAIPTFIHDSLFKKNERKRLEVLDREIELTSVFPSIIPPHVTFPSDVILEYIVRTERMASWSGWCYKNGMKAAASRIADLRTAREITTEILREHSLPDFFLSLGGQNALPSIYAASMDAAFHVASSLRSNGDFLTNPPSNSDIAVDTYARGIALDRHDSCILAVDKGFKLLNIEFDEQRGRLEDEYGLPFSQYGVDVVTLDKWTGKSSLSTSCGHLMPL